MIHVVGDNETAKGVRMMLGQADFPLGSHMPTFTIHVDEARINEPILDSIDCDLERRILVNIAALSPSGRVLIQRKDGIQSDAEIRITCPMDDNERFAVKTAVLRALLQISKLPNAEEAGKKSSWWKR